MTKIRVWELWDHSNKHNSHAWIYTICVVSHAFFGAVHGLNNNNNNLPQNYHGSLYQDKGNGIRSCFIILFSAIPVAQFVGPLVWFIFISCGDTQSSRFCSRLFSTRILLSRLCGFLDTELLLGAHDLFKILHFRDFPNWKIVV